MEIVNLVQIEIHRLGTTKTANFGGGFGARFERSVEVSDTSPAALRELIISSAQENGDTGPFDGLKQIPARANEIWFDIQGGSVQYSQHYASCRVITALKADGRYFKLEEVK